MLRTNSSSKKMVVGKKPMNHKILFLTFLSVFVNWNVVGQAFSDEEIVILAKNYDDIGSEVQRAISTYCSIYYKLPESAGELSRFIRSYERHYGPSFFRTPIQNAIKESRRVLKDIDSRTSKMLLRKDTCFFFMETGRQRIGSVFVFSPRMILKDRPKVFVRPAVGFDKKNRPILSMLDGNEFLKEYDSYASRTFASPVLIFDGRDTVMLRAVISYTRQDGIDLICDNSDSGSGVIVSGKQIKASPQDIVQLYCGQIEPFLKDYLERNRIYRIQFRVRVCYKEYAR